MSYSWKDKDLAVFGSNICRLCAEVNESFLPIFDGSSNVKNHVDVKIKKCFPTLIIDERDSKPKHICISCMSKLNISNDLYDQCLAADSKFNSILSEQCSLSDKVVETCVIKQSGCLWSPNGSKPEKTLTVHDGGVIVLSKMGSDILDSEHNTNTNRDFVVMVELKYKEPSSLPEEHNIMPGVEAQNSNYGLRDKLNSLVAYTDDTCQHNNDSLEKNKLCDNEFIGVEIKSPDEMQDNELMLFEPGSVDSTKDKCLRLLSSNCSTLKKTGCDKTEETKRRICDKYAGKKVFECSVCGKQFQRRTRLNSHMGLHTDVKPHACDQCNETFVMRWDLTLHQRIHARTFECEYCKKTFTVKHKLDRHMRTHTGDRPHGCGYCGKSFGDKRNLDNHVRTHTGEKPYTCDVCDRRFRVRTHLTDHQRVHTKATPFNCHTCGKAFRWKANFNMHMKMHNSLK